MEIYLPYMDSIGDFFRSATWSSGMCLDVVTQV